MKLHLSPSEVHQALMSQVTPALRYEGGDVFAWQSKLRRKVRKLLGYDVMPGERVPLQPKRLWKREHPLGTIEKLAFVGESKAHVTAYLCLPANASAPYAAMVCVQGHNSGMHHSIGVQRDDESKPMPVDGDRDFGIQCMARGIAALCMEQRAFGERRERRTEARTMCHETAVHALMLGRTLIGERVYDVDRGLDYLASRGDMDMGSIGIMGNSGGGTVSVFAAAMLPRISLAAPGSYFCRFKESLMSIPHCTCNYVPGLYRVADLPDIMGLFAPKPVVIVHGRSDEIFPLQATRKGFVHLRNIYDACGAADRCHLVVGAAGHHYYAGKAWPLILKEMTRLRKERRTGGASAVKL